MTYRRLQVVMTMLASFFVLTSPVHADDTVLRAFLWNGNFTLEEIENGMSLDSDLDSNSIGIEYLGFFDNGFYVGGSSIYSQGSGDSCFQGTCLEFDGDSFSYGLELGYDFGWPLTPLLGVHQTHSESEVSGELPLENSSSKDSDWDARIGAWLVNRGSWKVRAVVTGLRDTDDGSKTLDVDVLFTTPANYVLGASISRLFDTDAKGGGIGISIGRQF